MFKRKLLRIIASYNKRKFDKKIAELSEEQRFVYDIAERLLASSTSILESHPENDIIYVRNDLKLLKIDALSIHFINGKYSYSFSYDPYLMRELRHIFLRHKSMSINHMIEQVSDETTGHLKKIYEDLTSQ